MNATQRAIDFMSRLDHNGDFEGASAWELLEILDGWKVELAGATDSRGKAILNGINKIMGELKKEE